MRKLLYLIILVWVGSDLISCTSKMHYEPRKTLISSKTSNNIIVYDLESIVPENLIILGTLYFDNAKYSYEQIITIAKNKAQEVGGEAIQIIKVPNPKDKNASFRIKVRILAFVKVEKTEEKQKKNIDSENNQNKSLSDEKYANVVNVKVIARKAYIRAEPSMDSKAIAKVNKDKILEININEKNGDWYKVVMPDSSANRMQYGYIRQNLIEMIEPINKSIQIEAPSLSVSNDERDAEKITIIKYFPVAHQHSGYKDKDVMETKELLHDTETIFQISLNSGKKIDRIISLKKQQNSIDVLFISKMISAPLADVNQIENFMEFPDMSKLSTAIPQEIAPAVDQRTYRTNGSHKTMEKIGKAMNKIFTEVVPKIIVPQIYMGIKEYFPDSVMWKFANDASTVEINTNAGPFAKIMCEKIYVKLLEKNITQWMALANIKNLVLRMEGCALIINRYGSYTILSEYELENNIAYQSLGPKNLLNY